MGDRAQVFMKDEGVYLYTHWGAPGLVKTVQRALARRERWNDPEYLARIIFCEMVKGEEHEPTGFGIGGEQHGDVWRIVEVHCAEDKVRVLDIGWEEQKDTVAFQGSFTEFLKYK